MLSGLFVGRVGIHLGLLVSGLRGNSVVLLQNHFISVMLLVCIRVGKLQAPENPIEMQPIQLIMLSVCVRQMQARDPTGMKIVYEMVDLLAEIAQGQGFSELIWLERCFFARMSDSSHCQSTHFHGYHHHRAEDAAFLKLRPCAKHCTADQHLSCFQSICAYDTAHASWKRAAPFWFYF